jgi:hypothetical protein
MKNFLSLAALAFISTGCFAQNFYDASTVQEIRIYFTQTNWDQMLDTAEAGSDSYIMADSIKINGTTIRQVGVKYKGNSSYNPTQVKNPFHIELDTYIPQDYQGFTDIKLNNVKYDPSFVREAVSYSILRQYMHAPRANYANVYVNNTLIGLYTNVESISKKFVNVHFGSDNNAFFDCSPPAGAGPTSTNLPNLVYLGTSESSYYSAYDMKSDSGWADMISLTNLLNNNVSNIELEMDIDRALWMLAFDNVMVNLDSYLGQFKQNYYLYKDDYGRFNPIVWDLNMSFGTFSMTGTIQLGSTTAKAQLTPLLHLNDAAWPLVQKLLSVPTYKKKYLAHFKTIFQENLSNGSYLTLAQTYQSLISTHVQADPNKFYTFAQFQSNISSDVSAGGGGPGGLTASGLSALMNARNTYLSALADFTNVQPSISAVSSSVSSPAIGTQVTITANIINTNASAVYIGYRDDVYAPFTKLTMYDDGSHNDGASGDNVYGVDIPVNNITTQYYIYAENNNIGRFSPDRAEHEFYTLTASFSNVNAGDVAINELMALNTTTQVDETGIYEDWAELYNNTNADIDLGGYYMTDDTANLAKWQIPAGTIISAGGYLIIWCDEDVADGPLHTNFKLSSTSGESITLSNPNLNMIDQVFFGPQTANLGYARVPNGTGNFLVQAPTFNANNETTNITDYSDESNIDLSAFPNPSYGELYVKISHLIDNERIYLFNQLGQQIYEFEAQNENYLNLENMTSGFYFLKYGKKTVKVNIIN